MSDWIWQVGLGLAKENVQANYEVLSRCGNTVSSYSHLHFPCGSVFGVEDSAGRSQAEGCCVRENLSGLAPKRVETVWNASCLHWWNTAAARDLKFKMEAFYRAQYVA